jgi:hypothetical protein
MRVLSVYELKEQAFDLLPVLGIAHDCDTPSLCDSFEFVALPCREYTVIGFDFNRDDLPEDRTQLIRRAADRHLLNAFEPRPVLRERSEKGIDLRSSEFRFGLHTKARLTSLDDADAVS